MAAIVLVLAMVLIIGVTVVLIDLKNRRSAEAVHLQSRITDALLEDPRLSGAPLVAVARLPLWSGSPATVEVCGQVPTPDLRETALWTVEREAAELRPDVRIESRIVVVPTLVSRTA